MSFTMPLFSPAMPEILLLTLTSIVLVVDLYLDERNRHITYWLAQLSLLVLFFYTLFDFSTARVLTFSDSFVRDPMGDVLKCAIYVITIGAFSYSRDWLIERNLFRGEFYTLGLFGVLGMMVMVSAHNMLTLYLGLELLSLSLYALVAFNRDNATSAEAAMKYFVLGAIASGMLLYGMSMLYGASGSLDIAAIGSYVMNGGSDNLITVFGLVFAIVGLGFKLGAVPFHMWIPDVYQGAPTPVTLYIGAAPKIAAFAMFMRLLVEGMGGLHGDWQGMLVLLAVLSMGLGNVVAIAQTNIKRMLAYSTISHVGFILLGILAGTPNGYASSMFYTITYALMSMGAFGMIILMSRKGFEAEELDDYKGLNDRSPWFAGMMLVIMFSMAGVPPMVGFYAKLSVLQAVINVDMVWLAIVAVAFSVIGAFYYIRIVKLMYFDRAEGETPAIEASAEARVMLSVNSLTILLLGLFPGSLMAICAAAIG
jgi:NADH-quinone oxidoreductase subunit N